MNDSVSNNAQIVVKSSKNVEISSSKESGGTMSEIINNDGQVIVRPKRDIVISMSRVLKNELLSLISDSNKLLILDLTDVEMIDSVGIGVFITVHNTLKKIGGSLRVINTSKDIYGLFKMMRLDRHFEIHEKR